MAHIQTIFLRWSIGVLCVAGSLFGGLSHNWLMASTGLVVGLCCIAIFSAPVRLPTTVMVSVPEPRVIQQKMERIGSNLGGSDSARLAAELIKNDRYALLLRRELFASLGPQAGKGAAEALLDNMQRITTGPIAFATNVYGITGDVSYEPVEIPAFYVDKFLVTNVEFQRFVHAGGYGDESLWSREALVCMSSLVDSTGKPGPRFWSDSVFPEGLDLFPVVGISWYEANAYARWVGKRLLKDPEWVRAGTVAGVVTPEATARRTSGKDDEQTRFGWSRAPLADSPTPIDTSTPNSGGNGIQQLVGNVWQWTDDDFGMWEDPANRLETDCAMKYLRGAAFDTYFDSESATCFLSADGLLARKRNIGFRCAITEADIVNSLNHVGMSEGTKA